MSNQHLAPVLDGSVGHDERCDASPGADRPGQCAERAAVALLTSLGYEVREPPAAHRYARVQSGNREISCCVDCGTVWRSPTSRPPKKRRVLRPPPARSAEGRRWR